VKRLGYVVVEPSQRVERVPDRLMGRHEIRWPSEGGSAPEDAAAGAGRVYRRSTLPEADVAIYVWTERDPFGLSESVRAEIRRRAAEDAAAGGETSPSS
jgi:hypothetical protein